MKTKIITLTLMLSLMLSLCTRANEPPDSISWKIDGNTLKISGQGAIPDYSNPDEAPWSNEKSNIEKIVVEDGITRIGNLAFYGFTDAKSAVLAKSVESVGVGAFHYTEGLKTSLGEIEPQYLFSVESDHSVVSKDDDFILTINLTADFKNLNGIQTTLIYDRSRIQIDEKWQEEQWYNSVDDTNLGYISKPISGFVANNLRLMYVSFSGTSIDQDSPLYTAGKITLPIAKVKCKALSDILDINTSCFIIKESVVSLNSNDAIVKGKCSESQLTVTTRLPIPGLVIETANENLAESFTKPAVKEEKPEIETSIFVDGKTVVSDVNPYKDENGTYILPLRHTAEALGAIVSWNNETQIAFIWYNNEMSAVQIGQNKVFKNDGDSELSAIVSIKDSRTMVSSDFFQKALGAKVDIQNDKITITK